MAGEAVPQTIVFDLGHEEGARIRARLIAGGPVTRFSRLSWAVFAFNVVVQILNPLLRLQHHHWNDAFAWAWLALAFGISGLLVLTAAARWSWLTSALKPQTATTIAFGGRGLDIVDGAVTGARAERFVPFAKIRRVQLTADALVVMGGAFRPIVVIPKRALPGDGAPIMAFLEDRLVAKRMLQRSFSSGTTIVNTVSP